VTRWYDKCIQEVVDNEKLSAKWIDEEHLKICKKLHIQLNEKLISIEDKQN